jgi:hypothetical protein
MLKELLTQRTEEIGNLRKNAAEGTGQMHALKVERANFEMMFHQSEKTTASLKEKVSFGKHLRMFLTLVSSGQFIGSTKQ